MTDEDDSGADGTPGRRGLLGRLLGWTRSGQLGPWSATALVVGTMLGIGIFIGPPQVAGQLASPGWILGLWLCGGLFALAGALSVAELGAMRPAAGGDYVYIRAAFGEGPAFAAGWVQLLAIFPGSIATMALATASYQIPVIFPGAGGSVTLLGLTVERAVLWALLIIAALSALNHLGVTLAGGIQTLVTSVPALALVAVSVWVVGRAPLLAPELWTAAPAAPGAPGPTAGGIAEAYLPVYFAYSGWYATLYVGGEVRRPQRNLPLSLVSGTTLVTVMYALIVGALLVLMSPAVLAGAGEAGTAAARQLFGDRGAVVMAALIFVAMIGSINGTVLTGPRIILAMARQGDFPGFASALHPRHRTPARAIWLQAAWSAVLVTLGTAEALLSYTTAAMLITGVLTVLAVPRTRGVDPDAPRPYRAWLYPATPLLSAASSLSALAVLIYQLNVSVALAAAWFLGALLVQLIRRRRSGRLSG